MIRTARGLYNIEQSVLNYTLREREVAAGRGDKQLNEESALLKRAQRQHFELKNAELEGSLVSAVDVEAIMRSDYATTCDAASWDTVEGCAAGSRHEDRAGGRSISACRVCQGVECSLKGGGRPIEKA